MKKNQTIKKWEIRFLFSVLPILFSGQLLAHGGSISATTSASSYLLPVFVIIVIAAAAFLLREKLKKNTLRMKNLQIALKTLNQELIALKENREEIIQKRIKVLQEEIEIREQNMEAMNKALKVSKLSVHRNSFLLTKISHTLRTNLNDILGFSSLLGNEFALSEEQELFEFNENIRKSGASLMHLLNNIIDISKIESKNFVLKEEECHLADISKKLIRQYEQAANQKGIKIVFQEDKIPPFTADRDTVKHIFSNLIDNAVRYTEKGFIKISQTVKDKKIIWTIKDTGIGIDKAYLTDIFEPFHQQSLGYNKSNYRGSGLGLPLIKNLLDLLGGEIDIQSEKTKGTTVTVYLPFRTSYKIDNRSRMGKTAGSKKINTVSQKSELKKEKARILVLDEDKIGNMLIKKILPKADIEVYNTGIDPYKWIEQQLNNRLLPDVILIEMDFTGKHKGSKVLQKLKSKYPEMEHVPILALSAYPDSNGHEKAIQQGFTAYLQKPFHKNELINLLNQLLTI